jgi:hypothetical protein
MPHNHQKLVGIKESIEAGTGKWSEIQEYRSKRIFK